jgi:hypothetical protein
LTKLKIKSEKPSGEELERMPHLGGQSSAYIDKFTRGVIDAQSSPKRLNKQIGFIQTLEQEQ